jgi:cytidylate kinase
MIITIDGAVATGKSTVAKLLARSLGFIYFDTGAMYRAFTYLIVKHNIDYKDEKALVNLLENFDYNIKVHQGEKRYFVEKEDVTQAIRHEIVTSRVSDIAAIPIVRQYLVKLQRDFSKGVNAVFEGRDMGTVVFPNADLKIYLTGDPQVRAKRRYEELLTQDPEAASRITLEQVLEDINKRDLHDSTRENSPLKQAAEAFVVDTTGLDPNEVVFRILECRDALKDRKRLPPQQNTPEKP